MRTLAQIKREKGIKAEVNPDHLYTKVERQPKVFNDLQIPRNLQRDLPYSFKPKHLTTGGKKNPKSDRVAVVLEPNEKKVVNQVSVLKNVCFVVVTNNNQECSSLARFFWLVLIL